MKKSKLILAILGIILLTNTPVHAVEPDGETTGQTGEPTAEVVIENPEINQTENEDYLSEELIDAQEPTMWPVYLSVGSIGLTLVLITLINLSYRKKRKNVVR